MTEFTNFTDHFLIAMPVMEDPNFFQTVIYICEHTENGALGIVINRPTAVKFSEILQQMEIKSDDITINELPVLYGGPIHQERGFVIHRPSGKWKSSFCPSEHLMITTSRDILHAIAENKGPKDVVITLGYAGWGAGQLEDEVARNIWLCVPANESLIFSTPYDKRWASAAALIGIDNIYSISGNAGHA